MLRNSYLFGTKNIRGLCGAVDELLELNIFSIMGLVDVIVSKEEK